jgi:Domain of unknown function (DUF303).
MKKYIFLVLLLSVLFQIKAEVTLPKIFSSNMVLQRNSPVSVWGHAVTGEQIMVSFAGQVKNTNADNNGNWFVTLAPLTVNSKPAEMIITGTNTIKLDNILVGDVWLCSGQSNMEYPLDRSLKKYSAPEKGADLAIEELSKLKSDQIRYIYAEKQRTKGDLKSVGWVTQSNDSVLRKVSAVGYFFAKDINSELNVPVGIISTSWGGTRIEEWTPPVAYYNSAVFKDSIFKNKNFQIDGIVPGQKFESMLKPLIPFAIKGMLWYQGESNCIIEDQQTYPEKVRLMVETYRSLFKNVTMPFYYVQIAPYLYSHRKKDKKKHIPEQLAAFREAQVQCLSIPYSGMVVTTDLVDNASNIHPPYKWDVGHRLALLALNKTYGRKVVYSGPIYKSYKVKRNNVILSFTNIAGGLVSRDGLPLNWFSIAGVDGKFVSAHAEIKGNEVVVWSEEINNPVAIRFAWNESAIPNFCNKEGLPAVPFRTDK